MAESPADQGAEHWKQKYYDQLDRLDQKESEWAKLESVLKRAIGRLSLAAEGQGKSLDGHIRDIRKSVKDKVNRQRLDNILDDLSDLLAKMDEKRQAPDKKIVSQLQALLESLSLPSNCERPRKQLLKRLNKATDADSESLVKAMAELLGDALARDASAEVKKAGLFDRLLGASSSTENTDSDHQTGALLAQVIHMLPWPAELSADADNVANRLASTREADGIGDGIETLEKLVARWKALAVNQEHSSPASAVPGPAPEAGELESHRQCLLSFLNRLDNPESPNGRLAALRTLASEARQHQQLDGLASELAELISADRQPAPSGAGTTPDDAQPSIQEMLIRLLEQLVVPTDLNADVEQMKARLEAETDPADWKQLLKDVALLINSIRSRMQQEKHEFEDFLQQITDRLREMDEFLQIESNSLQDAHEQGQAFDQTMRGHVQDIRDDVSEASDLNTLKGFVENRLDVISQHIRDYRSAEDARYQDAQNNLQHMQSRMVSLEQETHSLKKVIVEKNKQAMFDALTGIPNRLAYEKKIAEEIARWKRFGNPLSIAVWDVDFFKKVNDSFGHKAGDKVLKTIAQLLNERIRETDFLARYGGEEFVMLLPGTKEEETLRLVNGLREKVEHCGFHYHGDPVHITVSCGVSSFRENDALEQVFDRADQALYRAKSNGRNQCVVASVRSD